MIINALICAMIYCKPYEGKDKRCQGKILSMKWVFYRSKFKITCVFGLQRPIVYYR